MHHTKKITNYYVNAMNEVMIKMNPLVDNNLFDFVYRFFLITCACVKLLLINKYNYNKNKISLIILVLSKHFLTFSDLVQPDKTNIFFYT